MRRNIAMVGGGILFALALGQRPQALAGTVQEQPELIRTGIVSSMFRDVPKPLIHVLLEPFGTLMEEETGFKGELVVAGSGLDLGRKLEGGQFQLGVFQGVEFAWAQQQYPDLRPLMLAVNQDRHLRACLIVRSDSRIAGFADLKEKSLAIPQRSHEHCYLFLLQHSGEIGQDHQHLLAGISKPPNAEDTVDDVVDGDVWAAVVDGVSLDCYQKRKPGRASHLKVIQESEVFPASVIAYRVGSLDQATRDRLREGLFAGIKVPIGRQLMTLWSLTGFEPIPDDYQETVTNILKVYPAPVCSTVRK